MNSDAPRNLNDVIFVRQTADDRAVACVEVTASDGRKRLEMIAYQTTPRSEMRERRMRELTAATFPEALPPAPRPRPVTRGRGGLVLVRRKDVRNHRYLRAHGLPHSARLADTYIG